MENKIERAIRRKATSHAMSFGSLPEAIGRFFFMGWALSLSASIMSFMKYAPDDIKQKEMNALMPRVRTCGSKRVPAKSGAANILTFLSHCRGLAVLAIWYRRLIILIR